MSQLHSPCGRRRDPINIFIRFSALPWLSLILFVAISLADEPTTRTDPPTPELDSPRMVVVIGAAGTDDYGVQFQAWADQWADVADQAGFTLDVLAPGTVTPDSATSDSATSDSVTPDTANAQTDHDRLQRLLRESAVVTEQPLWLVLIGHGTFSVNVPKFNLRGPDVSAAELAGWIADIDRPIVVINASSSSGPFVNELSGPNRVIVTATKSGSEQNFARFGGYFASAIGSMDADLDHDQAVSVREAFLKAVSEVESFYAAEDRIATEHALLDDNGDGQGSPSSLISQPESVSVEDREKIDGSIAAGMTITSATAPLPFTSDELHATSRTGIGNAIPSRSKG